MPGGTANLAEGEKSVTQQSGWSLTAVALLIANRSAIRGYAARQVLDNDLLRKKRKATGRLSLFTRCDLTQEEVKPFRSWAPSAPPMTP